MVDYINARSSFEMPLIQDAIEYDNFNPFEWQGIDFYPTSKTFYKGDKASVQKAGLGSLQLKFSRGRYPIFNLSNSLHKTYEEGFNHTDFTKTKLVDITDHICSILDIRANELKLQGKIEFSVNTPVSDANAMIEAFYKYKNTTVENMKKGHHTYGKKAYLSKYSIKLYNPMQKLKLDAPASFKALNLSDNNNLLRYEVEIQTSYIQKQWGIPLYTLEDLKQDAILSRIGAKIEGFSQHLYFKPIFPLDIEAKDLAKYYYFEKAPKSHLDHFRKTKNKTYKRHYEVYKLLKRAHCKPYQINTVIGQKWVFLMAN